MFRLGDIVRIIGADNSTVYIGYNAVVIPAPASVSISEVNTYIRVSNMDDLKGTYATKYLKLELDPERLDLIAKEGWLNV